MEKAYDIADLGKRLAASGVPALLNVAEAEAAMIYKTLKEWLKESAVISPNKLDDLGMPFIDQLDVIVNPQIDKINGHVG